ncbi:hypothetical protein BK004_04060 [bacterium CG10_46_32]|nr:MAG: hypothetical protein BK004_04060 [bacterium CG10_46_32]PIR55793.1 MAG: hypothetical protein COU73_04100 [Parcubacteria group bacterium CG10_big_fil_rev_8_21_14_0_10_46_32]
MRRSIIQTLLLFASVALLYSNWTGSKSFVVGLVGLAVYYGLQAICWGVVLERILPFNRAWASVFGFLVGFYLSAFAVGIPVVVWKYDRIAVACALLFVGLVGILLSLWMKSNNSIIPNSLRDPYGKQILKQVQHDALKKISSFLALVRDWHVIGFFVFSALFAFFIFHARTGVYIISPWAALSSFTLMLFFALAFLVGYMVLTKGSIKLVLAVIIVFSYLTHAYLPVIYETGFGGDKWRHLGAEQWLQEGNIYTPSIWGEDRSTIHFGPIAVPEALVAGNKTSYAAQWASTIFLSESFGVSLFWVDLLMVFLLWSLFLPLLLYWFGRLIFENERLGLLFAFLPTIFYTFQSEGAITIPVSFGHLFFFFILLLWAQYVKEGKRAALYAASVFSLMFYWGYILNFFVLLLFGSLAIAWRKLFMERNHWYKLKLKFGFSDRRIALRDKTIFVLLVFGALFAIPFLEIFQGLSNYASGSMSVGGVVDALADSFGRLSGFIGIIVPPDFIDQGNFLYNQSKESLSRLPLFSYRIVPFVVSMGVWTVIGWACYRLFRYHKAKRVLALIAVLFGVTLGAYFISWSFTEGVHILARRLNETIVFFMILFLGWGMWLFLHEDRIPIPMRKKILVVAFLLAFSATSTYASGPKLQMVTSDELAAARVVWAEHQLDGEPHCVIANTWPLLGLEAVSGRKITGGNFPMYTEYAQPERVKIFEALSKSPSDTWITAAFRVTGASTCYYMTENKWINDTVLGKIIELLGEPRRIGDVHIWRIDRQL